MFSWSPRPDCTSSLEFQSKKIKLLTQHCQTLNLKRQQQLHLQQKSLLSETPAHSFNGISLRDSHTGTYTLSGSCKCPQIKHRAQVQSLLYSQEGTRQNYCEIQTPTSQQETAASPIFCLSHLFTAQSFS